MNDSSFDLNDFAVERVLKIDFDKRQRDRQVRSNKMAAAVERCLAAEVARFRIDFAIEDEGANFFGEQTLIDRADSVGDTENALDIADQLENETAERLKQEEANR